jgi:hypothetical protein
MVLTYIPPVFYIIIIAKGDKGPGVIPGPRILSAGRAGEENKMEIL